MSPVTARLAVVAVVCAGLAVCATQAAADSTDAPLGIGEMSPKSLGFLQQKPPVREDLARLLRTLGATVENSNLPPWPSVPTPTITAQVPE